MGALLGCLGCMISTAVENMEDGWDSPTTFSLRNREKEGNVPEELPFQLPNQVEEMQPQVEEEDEPPRRMSRAMQKIREKVIEDAMEMFAFENFPGDIEFWTNYAMDALDKDMVNYKSLKHLITELVQKEPCGLESVPGGVIALVGQYTFQRPCHKHWLDYADRAYLQYYKEIQSYKELKRQKHDAQRSIGSTQL